MTMHDNSLDAFRREVLNFNQREADIWRLLVNKGAAMTDRQIRNDLFGPVADMNSVRPRITELTDRGWLVEVGTKVEQAAPGCRATPVRLTRALTAEERVLALGAKATQTELY